MSLLLRAPAAVSFSSKAPAAKFATSAASSMSASAAQTSRKLPVLLFDIMDTVVRDPFYEDIPSFFGMSMKELIECKHPTSWMEFEKGMIDELWLVLRNLDSEFLALAGLKDCMKKGYRYLDGMKELLDTLKQKNYEMHALTNYPVWYEMIEEKLDISAYLSWSFCSCTIGKRKPDPDLYLEVVKQLQVDPGSCIFVDDRIRNVEAASEVGMKGIHFKNADSLREDLAKLGINVSQDAFNLIVPKLRLHSNFPLSVI
ncbi:Flavin mononucleotide hydrolase 1, chloroplatic [Linum grandiflorum]